MPCFVSISKIFTFTFTEEKRNKKIFTFPFFFFFYIFLCISSQRLLKLHCIQDHWSTQAYTTWYLCTKVWSYQHTHITEHKQTLRTHSSLPDSGCDEPAERASLSGHKYVQCQDIQLAIPSPAESLADCFFCTFPATHAGVQYTQQKTRPCTHACTAQDYNAHTVRGVKGGDIWQLSVFIITFNRYKSKYISIKCPCKSHLKHFNTVKYFLSTDDIKTSCATDQLIQPTGHFIPV